jgi:hypothetical protein
VQHTCPQHDNVGKVVVAKQEGFAFIFFLLENDSCFVAGSRFLRT